MNSVFEALMRWWRVRQPEPGEVPLSAAEIAHGLRVGIFGGRR